MKTYKSTDASYAINKLVRAYRDREMNDPRVADYLEVIWNFSVHCRVWPLMSRVQIVMDILLGQSVMPADTLWKTLTNMKWQIEKINEKTKHMSLRENTSRAKYFNENNVTVKIEDTPEQLSKYDIVKVPTPGGFHYSIVADVTEEYVSCYPTTTASRRDLENMGCRSLSLSESGLEQFQGIRITTSEVKIPLEVARQSYKGTVAGNPFIVKTLARIVSMASNQ